MEMAMVTLGIKAGGLSRERDYLPRDRGAYDSNA